MNLDNLDTLLPEDDAAHIIMGGDWRMPTKEDYEELVNNTIFVDITEKYMVLKSKINNMLICFPKTGQAWSGAIKETSSTYVWSNQLYENMPDACTVLYINEDGNENIPYTTRFAGCVVRGVIK